MTLKLTLSPETEAIVRERAAALRQDLESFVLQALAERLAEVEFPADRSSTNGAQWADKLRACIDLHPAPSRPAEDGGESINGSRGE